MPEKPIHILGAGLSGLTSAIVLARAGREVHVHELRSDSGARFEGDFQGLENWSSSVDHLSEMRSWGIDPDDFKATEFRDIDLVAPDRTTHHAHTPGIAFWIVERGIGPTAIDQSLKRQALAAGARLHYNVRVDSEKCDIIATGPKQTTGLVRGQLFHTSHPNHFTLQLDDVLAPGAYTYMAIVDGVGLISTVLMRKQRDPDRFLNESIAWYKASYPELDLRPIRRLGGVGSFALARRHAINNRYYVGEAGGLQDCLWGFGMRYAITSGYLAARAMLGTADYEQEIRRRLRPLQQASLANRWWLNCLKERGMNWLIKVWMWDQQRRGDGLPFVTRLYRPSLLSRCLFPLAFRMLEADPDDELGIRRMPFMPAKARDSWPPSPAGQLVADQMRARSRP